MAWPASTDTLDDVLKTMNRAINRASATIQAVSDASVSGPVQRQRLVNILVQLAEMDAAIAAAQAYGADMVAYVRAQVRDPAFDVAAEAGALKAAGLALAAWIDTNLPRAGGGVALDNVDARGVKTPLTFGSAALAPFRAEAATFLATRA